MFAQLGDIEVRTDDHEKKQCEESFLPGSERSETENLKGWVKIVVEVMCTYMCTVHTQQCSVQFMDECDTACLRGTCILVASLFKALTDNTVKSE